MNNFLKIRKHKLKQFKIKNNNYLQFGILGLKSLNSGFLNFKHVKMIKQTLIKEKKKNKNMAEII